jgi:hypothetical protein
VIPQPASLQLRESIPQDSQVIQIHINANELGNGRNSIRNSKNSAQKFANTAMLFSPAYDDPP